MLHHRSAQRPVPHVQLCLSLGHVLKMFLGFDPFEPWRFYKRVLIKKMSVSTFLFNFCSVKFKLNTLTKPLKNLTSKDTGLSRLGLIIQTRIPCLIIIKKCNELIAGMKFKIVICT